MPTKEAMYDEAIEVKESGNLEGAVAKLEKLVEEYPDYALAHAGLSAFYSQLDRHEEAVAHGQKVCELDPDDSFSFMAMSMICQKAGKMAEAEHAMKQAAEKQWAAARKPAD